MHYPVPKKLARSFFGLKEEDFIILNLNRNQPRKRWDVCLQAFAEIVSRHTGEPIKLLVATAVQGSWNLLEVYERELKKRGLTLEEGMKHLILIDNPQQITDEEVNILYNVADIGFTTADGEGFGLCSFQQAAIGVPQVLPAIGGFLDFFDKDCAVMVEPKLNLYIDNSRDGCGGESQICDYRDFVDGIEAYYADRDMITTHGKRAREKILRDYKWSDIGDRLYTICKKVCDHPIVVPEASDPKNNDDVSLEEIENIISMKEKQADTTAAQSKPSLKGLSTKERLREKLKQKKAASSAPKENLDIDSLLNLKEKIDKLIAEKKA
jgi:glycosyltransferase involved in cell wall biosynthesis